MPDGAEKMRIERHVLFWLAALAVFVLLVALLKEILLPFVAGIVIAYLFNPLADRLSALGLNRMAAAGLIVGLAAAGLVAAVVLLAPVLLAQAQQLAEVLPEEISKLSASFEAWGQDRFGNRFGQVQDGLSKSSEVMAEKWTEFAGWVASSIWDSSFAIFNFLTLILVTPVVVFYLLVDWHPMVQKIDAWLPREQAPVIRGLAQEINQSIAAFIRGQGTVCLVLGVFYCLAFTLIGLKYGLLVGIMTGILTFVPVVGWATGFVTATTLAAIQFWPAIVPIALVVTVFLASQALDAAFLSPKIVGSKIGLHPVWLIFSLFVFSYLFGFVGVLIAVPLAAATAVLVRFALKAYLKSSLYSGNVDGAGVKLPPH